VGFPRSSCIHWDYCDTRLACEIWLLGVQMDRVQFGVAMDRGARHGVQARIMGRLSLSLAQNISDNVI
jgi:hypothetical protein